MSQLWDIAERVQLALGVKVRPANESINKETSAEQPVWNLLLTALSYEPGVISTAQLRKRNPYSAPSLSDQRLEALSARGWLAPQAQSEFRLTESGRAQALSILRTQRSLHSTIASLPDGEMNRVEELLSRLVAAAEKAATPPGTWCLTQVRRLAPPMGAVAVITKIDHYLSCLNAFRDDSHLAAWQAHDVSGPAWELLTIIWRGERKTLDELLAETTFRGQEREIYEAALQQLAAKGWIAENAGTYSTTAHGKALREKVEATTDQYFAEAESALTELEAQELDASLAKLLDALTK
jgi:hypothetical protein